MISQPRRQVIELSDYGEVRLGHDFFAPKMDPRSAPGQTARLGERFLQLNRRELSALSVDGRVEYDGKDASLRLQASDVVGGTALRSPSSGLHDLGLVVRPRFAWSGLGPTLLHTGWKVAPTIAQGPALPRSDRETPVWVLSSIVLLRLRDLLRDMNRTFATKERVLQAPKGTVTWTKYLSQHAARGKFAEVPCRFPSLQSDEDLRAIIHHVVLQQRAALESAGKHQPVVQALLQVAEDLTRAVSTTSPRPPHRGELDKWKSSRRVSSTEPGIEAIEWTLEERGLAGLADLQGLPWRLPMNEFFEAWVERIAEELVVHVGGALRRGRLRETVASFEWSPPFTGSQRYLLPDLVIDAHDQTIVIDAKYKHHWSEFGTARWWETDEAIRESHRADLLQVLAYASLFGDERITCVLVYPCHPATWDRLVETDRQTHRAELRGGSRSINVLLTAVPFGRRPNHIVPSLVQALPT